ncbi:MAG: hypothetical protein WCX95_01610 [Candidatus Gracilibacteria bacterium]
MPQGIPSNVPSVIPTTAVPGATTTTSITTTSVTTPSIAVPTNVPTSYVTSKGGGSSIVDAAQSYDILQIINRGIAYAIIIAGFLSVVFIFIGGISFILSGGQEDKIKSAVSTIRYAIIGLIITILATVIIGTVGKAMGLDIIRYINFGEIIDTIKSITSGAGSSGGPSLD